MASSVSSERIFSQAGITISKRRSRLGADIVEALQFLKCAIHRNLLFRAPPPTIVEELALEQANELDPEEQDTGKSGKSDLSSWELILDSDDEDGEVEGFVFVDY